MDYLMGIDIGTTAVKVIIIDANGQVMIKSNVAYGLLLPRPNWVEQDAEKMWLAVESAISTVLDGFRGDRRLIRALALSTQRDTLVCVDANGRPRRNAITWMDSRSTLECEALARDIGAERVYDITGVGVNPLWTFAFILWLKRNEPDLFEKIAKFALVHDYILRRLGASGHFLDSSNACQTMLYDYRAGTWSDELMRYGGLTAERLPILVEPGEPVGRIDPLLADRWGLSRDLILTAGGGDQQCAALGAGAVRAGEVEIGIGTAANLLAIVPSPVPDGKRRMICHRAAVSGKWVLEGAMLAMGRLVEWMKATVYPELTLAEIDEKIERSSHPGAGGLTVLPHFEGAACPYWNADATGVIWGLRLSISRADIARAFLESTCFEIRKSVELLGEFGLTPASVSVSGGASRSATWMQILADVLGVRVDVPAESDCAALGAAMLAGMGAGLFGSAEEAAGKLTAVKVSYAPNGSLRKQYDDAYAKNLELYEATAKSR